MAVFDGLPLATARLTLRPLLPCDAPALLAIHGDPTVMRYWSTPPWRALEDAQAFVARSAADTAEGQALRLGVTRTADARLIGQCTLFAISASNRRAEIGYSLAADSWGQGLMAEALRGLIGYGFGALALNRIEADVDPRNTCSLRLLERLGFEREGLLRQRWVVAGEVSDSALFGLLRAQWQP